MTKKEIAAKVYDLSAKEKDIKEQLKALKERLKEIGPGKFGSYVVCIEDRTKESFSIKSARTGLTEHVWSKLKAFIKTTEYKEVRVVKA